MKGFGKKLAAAHLDYIEREGVDEDGGKGKLFGENEQFDRDVLADEIGGEKRQFRFIVSPEDAEQLDLKTYTRDLMKQVESDLGRELHWGAVCHYNTENPHVHIVVRGIDKRGAEVTIPRDYLITDMRSRASEIATRELGLRSELDVRAAKAREITQLRVTSLDREISHKQDGNLVDLNREGVGKLQKIRLAERLKYLSTIGVAEHVKDYSWKVADDWKDRLVKQQRFGEKMKAIDKAGVDVQHKRVFREGAVSEKIVGRVAGIGMSDELWDKYYMVVETPKGEAYYADIDKDDFRRNDFRKGDIIEMELKHDKRGKPSDQNILSVARSNGNIYDSAVHRLSIEGDTVTLKDQRVKISADEFVEAHEKRMLSLMKYGYAEQLSETTWRVDPDFRKKLAELDAENPLVKDAIRKESGMTVEDQVSYRGRTWIDRFTANTDTPEHAGYGFGSEVRQAARQRAVFLRDQLGIDPATPSRARQLDGIEKNDLAGTLQKKSGYTFNDVQPGSGLHGELKEQITTQGGKRYAAIMNHQSKEFSLVPWQKDFADKMSKQVGIERGANGRWFMKQFNRGFGR